MSRPLRVLFLCVANSGRSLMAEALLRQHASGVAAHVFAGEERIHSIRADEQAA